MWFWLPTLILISLGALWWHSYVRFQRHWRRLIKVLDALGAGREPGSYIFLDGGRFEDLSEGLQKVAREQDRQRKLAEDERFNLRTILSSMEEGVMVVDSRRVIQRVNPSFLTLFRLRSAPIGQTVLQSLRQTDFEEMVVAALRTADPQAREVTLSGVRPARHIAVHAVPLRDSSGQLGVLAIFRDITRLKQLEEVRREFVANVSHELRTPLSIFHGYVEMLLENHGLPEHEVMKIFEVLKRHSLRLNALVEDLLVLARLESRRDEMQFEAVDLQICIHAVAMDWAAKTAKKGVTVDLAVAPDLPLLQADPLRLEQIFNNLLDNALKYTPPGGCIAIQAARDEHSVILCVEDNGAGIPPADLPHIFERFYRADKARSREMGGTGLGLSIVKHIAHAHGGSVHAESTYGKGTAILVRLPLEPTISSKLEDELSDEDEAELETQG
jgi:two-component system phosphate regulon sensor histidine kinase PhoR